MDKYQNIIKYISDKIKDGTFSKKLPSIRALANELQCSAGTVTKAYNKLEQTHIIYSVPKSGYFVVDSEISSAQSRGAEWIDFATAAPDIDTLPYQDIQHCLNNAIDLYKHSLFTYGNPQGLQSLLDVLARHLRDYQIFTKPENIVICTGSQQALNILCRMPFPNLGERVLLEQPTYYGMIKAVQINKVPAIGIRRDYDGFDLDELEKLFRHGNIKFFYTIPRFHNPTGLTYTKQEKEAIIRLAEKYNVFIVEDDIMADFDPDRKSDPLFALDASSRVIYLKSFSKILMPGLRVSALVIPSTLINTFLEHKQWNDMGTPILSQGALEIYLNSGMFASHRKKILNIHMERMEALRSLASAFEDPHITWRIPKSGFFACAHAAGYPQFEKINHCLLERNIRILKTSACFLPEYRTDNYFRICISKTPIPQIQAGIPQVIAAIGKYAAQSRQAVEFIPDI